MTLCLPRVPPSLSDFRRLRSELRSVADFLPSDLPGLQTWLEIGDFSHIYAHSTLTPNTPCVDGATALSWQERSAFLRHLTATNGPTYQSPDTGETDTPNGKGRLVFDGINDEMVASAAADWTFLHNRSGMEIVVVAKTSPNVLSVLLDTTNLQVGTGLLMYNDDASTNDGRFGFTINHNGGFVFSIAVDPAANVFPANEWHAASINDGGSEDPEMWLDACYLASATQLNPPSLSAPTTALRLGRGFSGTFSANKYAAVIAYNRKLAIRERRQLHAYLGGQYGFAAGNIACIGDSITSAFGNLVPYPTRMAGRLSGLWRVSNFGVSGAQTNAIKTFQWDHTTNGARRRRYNWVSYLAGINDIRGGLTGVQTWGNAGRVKDTLDSIRAEPGMRLLVGTLLPNKGDAGYNSTRQGYIDEFNNLVRQYCLDNADTYLMDWNLLLSDPNDPQALYPPWQFDYLHPNQQGFDLMAAAVGDKIRGIGLL